MKFFGFAALSTLFAAAASAQRIAIGYPADGASVTAGSDLVVEIDRPNSLSGSTEVAIVIAITSCASSCFSPSDIMGTILYNGGYNPQYHSEAPVGKPPHQNFTVQIPANLAQGKAQLNVAHVSLIGAGQAPFLETTNVTLTVQG